MRLLRAEWIADLVSRLGKYVDDSPLAPGFVYPPDFLEPLGHEWREGLAPIERESLRRALRARDAP